MEIADKVAIVTGAARGIGRATAVALAAEGARAVVLADVRAELSEETAKRVRAAGAEAGARPNKAPTRDVATSVTVFPILPWLIGPQAASAKSAITGSRFIARTVPKYRPLIPLCVHHARCYKVARRRLPVRRRHV